MDSSSVKGIQLDISDRKYFIKFVLEVSRESQAFYENMRSSVHIFSMNMASKRVSIKSDTSKIIYCQH